MGKSTSLSLIFSPLQNGNDKIYFLNLLGRFNELACITHCLVHAGCSENAVAIWCFFRGLPPQGVCLLLELESRTSSRQVAWSTSFTSADLRVFHEHSNTLDVSLYHYG